MTAIPTGKLGLLSESLEARRNRKLDDITKDELEGWILDARLRGDAEAYRAGLDRQKQMEASK